MDYFANWTVDTYNNLYMAFVILINVMTSNNTDGLNDEPQ